MSVKTIYLDTGVSLIEWVESNKSVIIETLYDNIFDFIEESSDTKLVLKIANKPVMDYDRLKSYGVVFDFMLVRTELSVTIRSLLDHYESIEDYEKCIKLVELQNKL